MRFHLTGIVVFAVVVLALLAGDVPAVAILRVGLALFAVAAFIEVVVNIVRCRNAHVGSRLLGLLYKSLPLAALLVLDLFCGVPKAEASPMTLYSTFGTGDTYNTNGGGTIAVGPLTPGCFSPFFECDVDQGSPFMLTNDARVETVEAAMFIEGGDNAFDLWIMSDNSGAPGAVLQSFQFLNAFGPCCGLGAIAAADASSGPILLANTKYWLVADAAGTSTAAGWYFSTIPAERARQINESGSWLLDNTFAFGFRLSGEAAVVPEPASVFLLGSGLVIGAYLWRMRKPII